MAVYVMGFLITSDGRLAYGLEWPRLPVVAKVIRNTFYIG